jgi:hypothetical protein
MFALVEGEHSGPILRSAGAQVAPGSALERAARRQLKDDPAITLNVTTVSTAEGLRDAVQSGALDIVITEHLDLTPLGAWPKFDCEFFEDCMSHLGTIKTTRSIRVRNSLFKLKISRGPARPGSNPCPA